MSGAITKWDEGVKNAFRMYEERDRYAYWYDAKGIILTDEAMDYLVSIHPEHFSRWSKAELDALKAYSRGRIGYDCSGFIWAVTGGLIGGSADSIMKGCPKTWENSLDNWAGTLLHKPGHVALDIGYGRFFHCPIEGHTIELGWSRQYDWTDAGTIPFVDYTGADAR